MPVATLVLHRKRVFEDEAIAELKLWRLSNPVHGSSHLFKYSLFYGRAGKRFIGYDNEAGKGDHRHYEDREQPYAFTTPEQLMPDFLADMRRLRGPTGGDTI